MNTNTLLIVVAVAAGLWLLKIVRSQIPEAKAKQLLASGARVIDVRSPGEFSSGHVRNAVNLPLGELSRHIHALAPDKSTPLLVHCLSGGRSAIARGKLRRLGYQQVHNLGSLNRAKQIVEG